MDLIKLMDKFKFAGKALMMFLVLSSVFTVSSSGNIQNAMKALCETAVTILGAGAILLIILAALVYAIGQVVGAETRARATVWATAMLTGAIIGILIYLILPPVILILFGSTGGGSGGGLNLIGGKACEAITTISPTTP